MSADGTKTQAWTWDAALQGIVPPMISPLSATGEVDDKASRSSSTTSWAVGAAVCLSWVGVGKARG